MTKFFVLSDVHLNGDQKRSAALHQALAFIKTQSSGQRPLVVVDGDLTDHGRLSEFQEFQQVLDPFQKDLLFKETLGNHDVRGPHSADWTNDETADPAYFHEVVVPAFAQISGQAAVNGSFFATYQLDELLLIFLNPEKGWKDAIALSAGQLQLLSQVLTLAWANGLLPLVFVHQALNGTHWRSDLNGGFGPQDGALKKVLQSQPQSFIFSGHIHNGFGFNSVIARPFGTCIDLPAFGLSEIGYQGAGLGVEVTVGRKLLTLQAFDFAQGLRLAQFDQKVRRVSLAGSLQQAKAAGSVSPAQAKQAQALLDLAYDQTGFASGEAEDTALPKKILFDRHYLQQVNQLTEHFLADNKESE